MVKEILNKFLILDGVTAAMVVGEKGDVIESVKSGLAGADALATALSFVMAESRSVAHRFGQGALNLVVIEFNENILIAGPVTREYFLAIVARTSSNIGQISLEMRKQRDAIAAGI